ncbi:MAG TPA: uroporphyrinogen-III synthase [Parafilimonas sp.]|nr:uroporphyrinogen-III synthase [Parafilimonas sp.]
MQKFKASILSTRPIDETLILEAKSRDILIDTISFIETEAIDSIDVYEEIGNAMLESVTVVFTSMNAVEAVAAHLHDYTPDWKIYCIGNTTKRLVVEYFGEDLIAGTATDATELAEKIIEDDITDEVIFFCGDKRRDELPSLLNENDIEVNEIEVYQTNMIHHTIEKNYDGILFFSPSAVQSFFSTNKLNDKTVLFAIGNTTASAIKKYARNKVIVADEAGKINLIEKAIEYFN